MRNGSTVYLVDTNIFIYAYTDQDPEKALLAQQLLESVASDGLGSVSTQVLNELFSKLAQGVQDRRELSTIESHVTRIAHRWEVLDTTLVTIQLAMRGAVLHQFSYWDSLIWAAAKLSSIPYVITEDFSHRQEIEGVTFLNPFADDFVLESQRT